VKVAFAGSRLLKNMLRHLQRRDGLAGQESSIRDPPMSNVKQKFDSSTVAVLRQALNEVRFIERDCKGEMK
jgi:hypothetical protein